MKTWKYHDDNTRRKLDGTIGRAIMRNGALSGTLALIIVAGGCTRGGGAFQSSNQADCPKPTFRPQAHCVMRLSDGVWPRPTREPLLLYIYVKNNYDIVQGLNLEDGALFVDGVLIEPVEYVCTDQSGRATDALGPGETACFVVDISPYITKGPARQIPVEYKLMTGLANPREIWALLPEAAHLIYTTSAAPENDKARDVDDR